jgi:hypothetical protein
VLRCPHCDYDLAGLLEERRGARVVCPECGARTGFTEITRPWEGLLPRKHAWAVATLPHALAVLILLVDNADHGLPAHAGFVIVLLALWLIAFYGGVGAALGLLTRERRGTPGAMMIAVVGGGGVAFGAMLVDVLASDVLPLLVYGV